MKQDATKNKWKDFSGYKIFSSSGVVRDMNGKTVERTVRKAFPNDDDSSLYIVKVQGVKGYQELWEDEMHEPSHSIAVPSSVKNILDMLELKGHEAYVVGGCVRDSFLGRIPKDWDITTSMRPEAVFDLFLSIPGFHVLPTGMKYGTITVIPPDFEQGHEITTFRKDASYSDGRHPDSIRFANEIVEDLSRRDLTINAIAYSPVHGLVDPYGGMKDLKSGVLRTVGNPNDRFKEDALRMMRVIRFYAQLSQLGFIIDPETMEAVIRNARLIKKVSYERRTDEIVKILMSDSPETMSLLEYSGLMEHVIPEVHECFKTPQHNSWHLYNVGEHTCKALENTPLDPDVRLAVLFHDIGKPKCHTVGMDGHDHFYGHPAVSEEMTRDIMTRMKFDSDTIKRVCKLVGIHDERPAHTLKAVRRFVSQNELTEEMFLKYHDVVYADAHGQNLEKSIAKVQDNDTVFDIFREIQNQPMTVKDLAVNGYDLMELGLKGPDIGHALEYLLVNVLDDPELNEKEKLIQLLKDRNIVLENERDKRTFAYESDEEQEYLR